jgi:hypothetical protein
MSHEDRRQLKKLLEKFARRIESLPDGSPPLVYIERALDRIIEERVQRVL